MVRVCRGRASDGFDVAADVGAVLGGGFARESAGFLLLGFQGGRRSLRFVRLAYTRVSWQNRRKSCCQAIRYHDGTVAGAQLATKPPHHGKMTDQPQGAIAGSAHQKATQRLLVLQPQIVMLSADSRSGR